MAQDPYAEFQKPAAAPSAAGNPYADFQQPAAAPTPSLGDQFGQAAKSFGGEMMHNLNPVNAVKGLGQTLAHPIDTLTSGMSEQRAKVGDDIKKGNYNDAVIHGIGGTIPILGPMYARGLDAASANDPVEGGKALADVTSLKAVPKVYGALASGLGKAVAAPAGPIAETALGVRKLDRAYGKTPGQAILDETKGVRPSTIADSARSKLGDINQQLDTAVNASTTPASLKPALDVIGGARSKALAQNSKGTLAQLDPMTEHLSTNVSNGLPLSQTQMPSGLLNLKRGFGNEFVHNWNPETMKGVKSTGAQAYRALDDELDRTVPAAKDLNQRASSLIPVAQRAESTDLNANTLQRALGRVARPTGGMASAIAGAYEGGTHFGPLGALGGAVVGGGLPELIASPTAQMIAARGLNATGKGLQSPVGTTAARVAGSGALLKKKQQPGE